MFFYPREHPRGVHIANDDQESVIRPVPLPVEFVEHRSRRIVKGWPCPECVVGVRRVREQRLEQPGVEDILRVREVLGDFLFDRSAFEPPELFRVEGGSHPDRLDLQCGIEGIGGNGQVILRHDLLGVGVGIAPQGGTDCGELGGGKPRTPAEHHVFLGVCHPRESLGRLVGTGEVVDLRGHHRRERVPDDDHPQPVLERRPDDIRILGRPRVDRKKYERRKGEGNKRAADRAHAIPPTSAQNIPLSRLHLYANY